MVRSHYIAEEIKEKLKEIYIYLVLISAVAHL